MNLILVDDNGIIAPSIEPGEYLCSIHPSRRIEHHPPVFRVRLVIGLNYCMVFDLPNLRGPLPLEYHLFRGARWERVVMPGDPFAQVTA